MKGIQKQSKFNGIKVARASFLVLAVLVFVICFKSNALASMPAPPEYPDSGPIQNVYSWKRCQSLDDLPKTGDKNILSDKDWYPIMIYYTGNKITYLTGFSPTNTTKAYGQTNDLEGFRLNAIEFPFWSDESNTLSDYSCLYIKYAGKNLNDKDVYYLKRSDGWYLVTYIDPEHTGYMIAVSPENMKKPLNAKISNSTWDHYSCGCCWYEDLDTWEFVKNGSGNYGVKAYIKSGHTKYDSYIDGFVTDDTHPDGYAYRTGSKKSGSYSSINYGIKIEENNTIVKIRKDYSGFMYSFYIGTQAPVYKITKPMTIDGGSTFLVSSSSGCSFVDETAPITVKDGSTLIIESGVVIWGGELTIESGGTVILYPGARMIMTDHSGEDRTNLTLNGSLIVMDGAAFWYAGNNPFSAATIWMTGIGDETANIENHGVMIWGYTDLYLRDKSQIMNEGLMIFGKTIMPDVPFSTSSYDGKLYISVHYPELLLELEEFLADTSDQSMKKHLSDIKSYTNWDMRDYSIVRNNGEVYLGEKLCYISSLKGKNNGRNNKWIGVRKWYGTPYLENTGSQYYRYGQTVAY